MQSITQGRTVYVLFIFSKLWNTNYVGFHWRISWYPDRCVLKSNGEYKHVYNLVLKEAYADTFNVQML
jgi:hypothetical protein